MIHRTPARTSVVCILFAERVPAGIGIRNAESVLILATARPLSPDMLTTQVCLGLLDR